MDVCEVKIACDGVNLIVGETITLAVHERGEKRCIACTATRSAESDALKGRAAIRLFGPGVGVQPHQTAWRALDGERQKAELAYQRELDATNGIITTPGPSAYLRPTYSGLTEQEQRILDERKAAYEPQDKREEQRIEGSVYCRELGFRYVNGRWTPVCKIGYAGIVKDREQECDRWSIDGDEITTWRIEHTNARWLEREIHTELKMRGKHRRKEIFNVDPEEARDVAETILEMADDADSRLGRRRSTP